MLICLASRRFMFMRMKNHIIFLLGFLLFTGGVTLHAQQTVIEGLVLDYFTKEPLPYATLVFKGSNEGTTSDVEGRFELSTSDLKLEKVTVSYLGYDSRTISITPGIKQRTTIELKPDEKMLQEIDVVGERRIRKDTAANTLFRRVVRHKKDNAPGSYTNYAYESYTKTIFGLYDINEKFPNRIIVRKVPFVFDNTDTLESGITVLPGLLKETYKHILYRKQPSKTKEYLIADRFSGVENNSLSDLVEFNYEDINPYENTINVNGKPVMSPFADNALLQYKYFLTDTLIIDGYYCYQLQFTGRSSKDNAFSGYAMVHDTTFAIKSIHISLLPQANINFISLFELVQTYERQEGGQWFMNYESFQTNMNLLKKPGRQSFMAKKESWRRNILIDHPAIDTLVEGSPREVVDGARERDDAFWEAVRVEPLPPNEANVYPTADSVLNIKVIKFLEWFLEALQTRYLGAGPVEIGQFDQLYSYNALEGARWKVGMRTSTELTKQVLLSGYFAYGKKDQEWKYGASFRSHLKRRNELWHMLGASYKYDYGFVGNRERNDVHDNILNVLLRSDPIDNIFLTREALAFYEREWMPGLTTRLEYLNEQFYSVPPLFNFDPDGNPLAGEVGFTTSELAFKFTWGKGLRYYESSSDFERTPVTTVMPRLHLEYRAGIDGLLGGDVGYHKLEVGLTQRLLSPIGITKYQVLAGKYFGTVPYPLLELHRGNESVYFEKLSFNVMNDFEFASDMFVTIGLEHHFDGFLLNKIPGIKFLQLRTIFYYKVLLGWLSDENQQVVPLLDDMSALDGHYSEIGVGLENILKLFRVDAIFRLTQKDKPGIQKWGIRFLISPKF